MRHRIEPLESRRLLAAALPTSLFAQSDDTYTVSITGTPSLATIPITSVAWGVTVSGATFLDIDQDRFTITVPSGPASTVFFHYFETTQDATSVRIEQRAAGSRLRARWDLSSFNADTYQTVSDFSQALGADGVLYDTVSFDVPRITGTYYVPNPAGGADVATTFDYSFILGALSAVPPLASTGYMSTSPDVRTTMEFKAGQMPLTSYNYVSPDFHDQPRLPFVNFSAVASVDGIPLWARTQPQTTMGQVAVFTARDSQARPVSRTRFSGTSGLANEMTRYGFSDTTLDNEPRIESYVLRPQAVQIIGYSYNAGTGAMNTPSETAWNFVTNSALFAPIGTAFIKPPTFGVRNTPLSSINIQTSGATLGLADFQFENLVSAGLTYNGGTLSGLAAQQTVDGDYAVKLFAVGSTWGIGSTGIKWTLDTTAPLLLNRSFEYETGHSVSFNFSESVNPSFSAADLTLVNLTNNTTIPAGAMAVAFDGSIAHLTFPGLVNGILPDGNYRATLNSAGVSDVAGNALLSGDVFNFFVLAGDANRDQVVNFDDLLIVAQNYNQAGHTFSQGNFNYSTNGLVDFDDLLIVAQQYGRTLAITGLTSHNGKFGRRVALRELLA